jgi:hypothetical protein
MESWGKPTRSTEDKMSLRAEATAIARDIVVEGDGRLRKIMGFPCMWNVMASRGERDLSNGNV